MSPKNNQNSVKFSRLCLKSKNSKKKVSIRKSEKISKFFPTSIADNHNHRPVINETDRQEVQCETETNQYSPYKTLLTDIPVNINNSSVDENDFKIKQNNYANKSCSLAKNLEQKKRVPKKKCKQSVFVTSQQQYKNSDFNSEHLQVALALSLSLQSSTVLNTEDDKYPSTQEKIATLKTTLDQFGFKSNSSKSDYKAHRPIEKRSNRKSRYQYVTPILLLRKEADRERIIADKVATILSETSSSIPTTSTFDETLDSNKLQQHLCSEKKISKVDKMPLDSLNDEIFYVKQLNIPVQKIKCGSLLKDWHKIPGRDVTPPRQLPNICMNSVVNKSNISLPVDVQFTEEDFAQKLNTSDSLFSSDDELHIPAVSDSLLFLTIMKNSEISPTQAIEPEICETSSAFCKPFASTYVVGTSHEKETEQYYCDLTQTSDEEENVENSIENFLPELTFQNKSFHNFNSKILSNETEYVKQLLNKPVNDSIMMENENNINELDVSVASSSKSNLHCKLERIGFTDLSSDEELPCFGQQIRPKPKEQNKNENLLRGQSLFTSTTTAISDESIYISDEELNYSMLVVQSPEINTSDLNNKELNFKGTLPQKQKEQNENENLLSRQSSFTSITTTTTASDESVYISDEELNYSSMLVHSPEINISGNNKEEFNFKGTPLQEPKEQNENENLLSRQSSFTSTTTASDESIYISDEELNYSSMLVHSPEMNTNGKNKEEFNIEATPSQMLQDDNNCTTPKHGAITKTNNVTSIIPYDTLDTPQIHKELSKYGVKSLKRRRGVQLLKHIHESAHPSFIKQQSSKVYDMEQIDKELRKFEIKSQKRLKGVKILKHVYESTQPIVEKESIDEIKEKKENVTCETIEENIEIVGDLLDGNELIFEKKQSSKIASCRVPLHIAWHNLVSSKPQLREAILFYKPLNIEGLYDLLKMNGYRYHIQDLLTFLDKKCITVRLNQKPRNNRSKRKKIRKC